MEVNLRIVETSDKIPISFPSEGAGGRTGSWRLERPIVNNDKCTRCFLCEIYCPVNVIDVRREGVLIDYNYCKGCGICMRVCPQKAITMIPESEEGK
ncbi:MAG: 4Fe-4S binding protein [Fervidicoccaceae archaeon]